MTSASLPFRKEFICEIPCMGSARSVGWRKVYIRENFAIYIYIISAYSDF
jgi:hypothetical protein